jgi:hypothetical protein
MMPSESHLRSLLPSQRRILVGDTPSIIFAIYDAISAAIYHAIRGEGSLDIDGTEDGMVNGSLDLDGINEGNLDGSLDVLEQTMARWTSMAQQMATIGWTGMVQLIEHTMARLTSMAQQMANLKACLTWMAKRMASTTAHSTRMASTKARSTAR